MTYTEFVKRVLTVAAVVVIGLAVWYLRSILLLAFLSAIIAVSLTIPVGRLQRMGMRRGPAIATTLLGVFATLVLFFTWILPTLVIQVAGLVDEFPTAYEDVRERYENWHEDQSDTIQTFLPTLTDDNIERFGQQLIDLGSPLVANAGNTVIGVGANLVVVIIVAIFFLLEPMTYVRGIISLTPPDARVRMLELMVELRNTLTTWLTALTFSISITAFLVWLVLGIILGVPNGLALGVIAGVATIIPNIGSIIPLVPIVIFTLADDVGKLPFVLGAYFAIQQLESNVMTPTIVKRELNIPAGLTFMFQLTAAALFGFLGILLAVPMLATLITLVRELYVYDILDMRNVDIDIEETNGGELKLVSHPSPTPRDTANIAVVNIPRKLPDTGGVEASPD